MKYLPLVITIIAAVVQIPYIDQTMNAITLGFCSGMAVTQVILLVMSN